MTEVKHIHISMYDNESDEILSLHKKIDEINTRNSRQRVANYRQSKKIEELKQDIEELESLLALRGNRKLIRKFDTEYSLNETRKRRAQGDKAVVFVYPDAEEVYKRYYYYKNSLDTLYNLIESLSIDLAPYNLQVGKIKKSTKNIIDGEKEL